MFWEELARKWDRYGPPICPDHSDVAHYRAGIAGAEAHVLLLGVTPQLAGLGTRLTALDGSQAMIDHVWPGNTPGRRAILGDWRRGETIAQSGRGMTWTDPSAATANNGGNCYNCHELAKAELSYGTIGPSLHNYGKLRGVSDPASPGAKAIVEYTWGKLWNTRAYNACSNMPRFGHAGLLNEQQLKDIMALLLDPRSPVNQ